MRFLTRFLRGLDGEESPVGVEGGGLDCAVVFLALDLSVVVLGLRVVVGEVLVLEGEVEELEAELEVN